MSVVSSTRLEQIRRDIVGIDQTFQWPVRRHSASSMRTGPPAAACTRRSSTACSSSFGPFVGNTHSEASVTGSAMTLAYHEAHRIIKDEVNAGPDDVLLSCGSGMTGAVNKFQRILGLKAPQGLRRYIDMPGARAPGGVRHPHGAPQQPDQLVRDHRRRGGHPAGRTRHAGPGRLCRAARAAPRAQLQDRLVLGLLQRHRRAAAVPRAGAHDPRAPAASPSSISPPRRRTWPSTCTRPTTSTLDAVFFSPHKYLGGPGASGVLVFNRKLYRNSVPDDAGGGTVAWTNPWGQYAFIDDIEAREDGGTPPFLQTIRAALAMRLKAQMDVDAMAAREREHRAARAGRPARGARRAPAGQRAWKSAWRSCPSTSRTCTTT